MNLAVRLGNEMSGGILEGVGERGKEKVGLENGVGLGQTLLSLLKVKVDVESPDKLADGVGVLVGLLSYDAHKILELLLVRAVAALGDGAVSVGDYCGGEVAENPGACGLDGVDVGGGEEELGEGLAGGLVVEEGVQRPVDEPAAVLELGERVAEEARVDLLAHLLNLLHDILPLFGQDVGDELSPGGSRDLVVVGALVGRAWLEMVVLEGGFNVQGF